MNLTWLGKTGIAFMIACCMLGVVGMAIRLVPMLWCSVICGVVAAGLSIFEAIKHKR